jgi:hypothetical protein
MTLTELTRHRLHQQQLVKPQFDNPADVVEWLGAVQAQDFFGALWTIGQRMNKTVVESEVEKAVNDRTIVRTWPMRGTLHFVAPKDVRWMLKYLTPRVVSRMASHYRKNELDTKVFTKCRKLWTKALEGGKQLSRDEMYDVLERAKIPTANMRGLFIIGQLAREGFICWGSRKGKQQTFVLMDEWLPSFPMLKKDEALGELAVRYFTSHGPAVLEDFMWWAGLPKGEASAVLASVKSQLAEETINGKRYYFSSSAKSGKINPATTYLLPTYDEYGIAYKERDAIIDLADLKKMGGPFFSGIMMNGKMIGAWRRTLKKDSVHIETQAFRPFTKAQKSAITAAAKRYSKFLGSKVSYTLEV